MGVLFVGRESDNNLGSMGNSNAQLFVLFTSITCDYYSSPSVLSPITDDIIYVQEESFCHLVEVVVEGNNFYFYSWAQIAANYYEVIKDEQYQWHWQMLNSPLVPFCPRRQSGFTPNSVSTKVVGRLEI